MNLVKSKLVFFPLLVLVIGSVFFRLFPWDMAWADYMHSPELGWHRDETGFWKFIYDFGVVPAVLLTLSAFILLMVGVGHPLRKYRKQCLYIISCLALGPGIITNGLLKEFWGRPRPKQIDVFGGQFPYEELLTIDPISTGKSFPCGHATMGFFFFSLAFLFLSRNKKLFWAFNAAALAFGLLIGYARLVQGGHFPSDTLWAAGVCWFVSLGLYRLFNLQKKPLLSDQVASRRPWWMVPAMLSGVVGIVFLVSLATPYSKTIGVTVKDLEGVTELYIDASGSFKIEEQGEIVKFEAEGTGHRLPKSRHKVKAERDGKRLVITIYKTGVFTELNLENTLIHPPGMKVILKDH